MFVDDQKEAVCKATNSSQLLPTPLYGLHPGREDALVANLRTAAGWDQRCQRTVGGDAGQEVAAG